MNENQPLGEVLQNGFSNLLSSAGDGIKGLFTDNRAIKAQQFASGESPVETKSVWTTKKIARWILQITTGYLSYYGAMHILKEPIVATSPENGAWIAILISLFLVGIFEISVFAVTDNATFYWLKTTHKHYSSGGKALFFSALLLGLCYISWRAAQEGALDIVVTATDQKGVIIDKKSGDLEILKSQYKSERASMAKMYNESVRSAEQALSEYSKAGKTADGKPTWRNPATVDKLTASVESAKKERKEALAKIDADYKQGNMEIEAGAAVPLADNTLKQSIYQRNIWWFSILLEFFRCLCVYLVAKGEYLYKSSNPKQQQRRQEYVQQEEPQIFVEKKTEIYTPQPIQTVEETQPQMSRVAAPIVEEKDWIGEYVKLMKNRASFASRVRNADKQGNYDSALKSWLNNEPLIEAACNALNRAYDRPKQPINAAFVQTNP